MPTEILARSDIQVDAVFDIETHDWTQYVVGGIAYADGDYSEHHWRDEDGLVDAILSVPPSDGQRWAWVWAHNGGRFDALWLGDRLHERGQRFDMITSGSGIAALRVGRVQVLDSFMLTKQKLSDLTASLGVSKDKLALPCDCGDDCGGYCSISRTMSRAHYKRLCQYLERDCNSLRAALGELRAFALERDIDLGITVGSSAWKTARRWLDLPENDLLERAGDFRFARQFYFGGRVFKAMDFSPGAPIFPKAMVLDVNSMYPAALLNNAVPAGKCLGQVWNAKARKAYRDRRPGIYAASVRVPEMHIPPLPIRDAQDRCCYPWGEFQGGWPLPELEYAESLGCTVTPFRAVLWEREEKTFAPWARKLFDIRANCPGGKKSPMGNFCKFLLNSLTGKLGAKATVERNFHDAELDPMRRVCRCTKVCKTASDRRIKWKCGCRGRCERYCAGACGAVLPFDKRAEHNYWRSEHFRIQECAHPQVSGYLTGNSRGPVWHAQAVRVAGGLDVCYGDTDSLACELGRDWNIGSDIGQWSIEGQFSDATFVAPKMYDMTLREPGKSTGARKAGAKGIKLPAPGAMVPAWGKRTVGLDSGQRIAGVRTGMRTGVLFQKKEMDRSLSWQWGDRIPLADGTSRPPRADEIEWGQT